MHNRKQVQSKFEPIKKITALHHEGWSSWWCSQQCSLWSVPHRLVTYSSWRSHLWWGSRPLPGAYLPQLRLHPERCFSRTQGCFLLRNWLLLLSWIRGFSFLFFPEWFPTRRGCVIHISEVGSKVRCIYIWSPSLIKDTSYNTLYDFYWFSMYVTMRHTHQSAYQNLTIVNIACNSDVIIPTSDVLIPIQWNPSRSRYKGHCTIREGNFGLYREVSLSQG